METITFKGKKYPTRTFTMTSDETDEVTYTIADQTLLDALSVNENALNDFTSEERQIDDQIYFYVCNGELELDAEEICKSRLDIKFEFIEE